MIKVGGSLITDKTKPFTAREAVIKRLGKEIKAAAGKFPGKIVLGHGSGSFGHTMAAKYQTQKGIINKQSIKGLALTADAAVQINRIVIKNFLKIGLPVFSLSPSSFLTANNQKPDQIFLRPILEALDKGLVPIIYGDVILDCQNGCCIFSSETTLNILASGLRKRFKILKVIYCGDTNGVYDGDGQTIPLISQKSFSRFRQAIGGSAATDVTGGMLHKVEESLALARRGIPSLIINGKKPGNLKKAILGQEIKGTWIR